MGITANIQQNVVQMKTALVLRHAHLKNVLNLLNVMNANSMYMIMTGVLLIVKLKDVK